MEAMTKCARNTRRQTLARVTLVLRANFYMDPARPNDPDPADPFNPERADHEIIEKIVIATEGEDCDECVRKLREPLGKIDGVKDVKVDTRRERVVVTFDARKVHPPDLHDAILKSGYKPAPFADD
jgi:copper chaperone CopZ